MPPDPREIREPHMVIAGHIGREYDRIVAEMRQSVDVAGVHHVEYYDRGLPTVAVDVLPFPELAEHFQSTRATGARSVERARRDYETIGRQLSHRMTELNNSLVDTASGPLIRAVFAAPDRAVIYLTIDEGQYIVGTTLAADTIDEADRALSAMAGRLRDDRALPDLNYGGSRNPGEATIDLAGPVDVAVAPAGFPGERLTASLPQPDRPTYASPNAGVLHRSWSAVRDTREEIFQAQALAILDLRSLHYIGLIRGPHISAADILDHDGLSSFFVGIGRAARRDAYQKVGAEFLALSDLLDGLLRSVLNRRLTRTVLDVEKGALYLHRISRDEFLLGVTLDQRRVGRADQRFQLLVQRFGAAGG